MKLKLTQVDSGMTVKVDTKRIDAMMALANCTRIRLENGVELTVSETAREIDRMTKGGK